MTDTNDSDVLAIHNIRERTMHAENTGDVEVFDSVCADDVVVMPPNMPGVAGRSAAVGFMRELFGQFEVSVGYVSVEIAIHGDIAFDRGTYSQTLSPKGGGTSIRETGKFLWLYSRNGEGGWRISHVMWNASGPPASE